MSSSARPSVKAARPKGPVPIPMPSKKTDTETSSTVTGGVITAGGTAGSSTLELETPLPSEVDHHHSTTAIETSGGGSSSSTHRRMLSQTLSIAVPGSDDHAAPPPPSKPAPTVAAARDSLRKNGLGLGNDGDDLAGHRFTKLEGGSDEDMSADEAGGDGSASRERMKKLHQLKFQSLRQQSMVGAFYVERVIRLLTRVCEAYSVLETTINKSVKEEISLMRKFLQDSNPDLMSAYCNAFDTLRSFIYDLSVSANEIEMQVRSQVIQPLQEYHQQYKAVVNTTTKLHDAAMQEYQNQVKAREQLKSQCQKYVDNEKEAFKLIAQIRDGDIPAHIKKKVYAEGSMFGLRSMFKKSKSLMTGSSTSLLNPETVDSGADEPSKSGSGSDSGNRHSIMLSGHARGGSLMGSQRLGSLYAGSSKHISEMLGTDLTAEHSPGPPMTSQSERTLLAPLSDIEDDDQPDELLHTVSEGAITAEDGSSFRSLHSYHGDLIIPATTSSRRAKRGAMSGDEIGSSELVTPEGTPLGSDFYYITTEYSTAMYRQMTQKCAFELSAPLLHELIGYLDIRDKMAKSDEAYLKQTWRANASLKNYEEVREKSLQKLKDLEMVRLTSVDESFWNFTRLINSDVFLLNQRPSFQDFHVSLSLMKCDDEFGKYVANATILQSGPYRSPPPLTYEMRFWRTSRHLISDLMSLQKPLYPRLAIPFVVEYLISFIEIDPYVIEKYPDLLVDPNLLLMDDELPEWREQLAQLVKGEPVPLRDYLHACGLLKLWLSELVEPVIPYCLYEACMDYDGSISRRKEAERRAQQKKLEREEAAKRRKGGLRSWIPLSGPSTPVEPTSSALSSSSAGTIHATFADAVPPSGTATTILDEARDIVPPLDSRTVTSTVHSMEHHSTSSQTAGIMTDDQSESSLFHSRLSSHGGSVSGLHHRSYSATDIKIQRRVDHVTNKVLVKMDPTNVLTLVRIIGLAKQILNSGKGKLSDLAFELGPLLLRNPVVKDKNPDPSEEEKPDMTATDSGGPFSKEVKFVAFLLKYRIPMLSDAVIEGAHTLGHLHTSAHESEDGLKADEDDAGESDIAGVSSLDP